MARALLSDGRLTLSEGAAPATPASGEAIIFIDTSGNLCKIDDAGNVMTLAFAGNFTLTAPASGTVSMLGVAQTFTAAKTFEGPLVISPDSILTIASGVVTATGSSHRIDTEAGAATDDLDTINGGVAAGQILLLRTVASARDVTVKHGTGNIRLDGSADKVLANVRSRIMLIYSGAEWHQVSFSASS